MALRAFRSARYVKYKQTMNQILKLHLDKRKILSAIAGISSLAMTIHSLGLIWLTLLCRPGTHFTRHFVSHAQVNR